MNSQQPVEEVGRRPRSHAGRERYHSANVDSSNGDVDVDVDVELKERDDARRSVVDYSQSAVPDRREDSARSINI